MAAAAHGAFAGVTIVLGGHDMAKQPWNLAAKARNDFADLVESVGEDRMGETTLSDPWTVKHVLAHLVFIVEMKMPSFMLSMAKAGFNYDKMADRVARDLAASTSTSTADLLARLRAGATNPAPMPGFAEMITVGDVAIHTQDVRRSLGLDGALDPEVLKTALEFITTQKIGLALSDVGDGKRFDATDLDWSHGEGPTVSGPGEAILMTLAGRVTGELDGL